ncbi:hypothetical protein DH2020_045164 [Rehmannia glutinosa]|uniref:Solute carrier family 40 member n=1 Tax=Rehmannia glutinosa TaxID=99300 RepID=A0ABR0UF13_REHGL
MAVLVIAHGQPSAGLLSRSRFQGHITSSSCLRLRRPRLWLNPHFAPPRYPLHFFSCPQAGLAHFVRCTHTNSDGCNSVATDEVHEDTTSLDSDCSVPVVHLKSDSLETEGLNLLGDTYAGTILTELPVLSDEEQNAVAATPAHPAGLYVPWLGIWLNSFGISWPAAIALIHPSLLPVAVMGFFVKVFVHINSQGFQNKKQVGLTIDAPASEQLAVIVGGPLVGKLMDHFPRVPAYNCLTVIQVAAQLLSVGMIIHAHNIHPSYVSSVLVQPWFVVLVIALAVERLSGLALGVAMERDWVVLLAGTNRTIALAQANAVLSRIDLLCEIAGASLFGIFLSKYEPVTCLKMAASLMMWSLPVVVISSLAVLRAGAAGLIFQAALLTIAVAVYWIGSFSRKIPLIFFLCLIILSRLGHMSYDVIGAQILQTGIPASKANLIGTTEVSFASLAESVMLGVAIIANDVSHFGFLAMLSLMSVVGAAWLYCGWLKNPTDTQRSLFSFERH